MALSSFALAACGIQYGPEKIAYTLTVNEDQINTDEVHFSDPGRGVTLKADSHSIDIYFAWSNGRKFEYWIKTEDADWWVIRLEKDKVYQLDAGPMEVEIHARSIWVHSSLFNLPQYLNAYSNIYCTGVETKTIWEPAWYR